MIHEEKAKRAKDLWRGIENKVECLAAHLFTLFAFILMSVPVDTGTREEVR